MKYIWLSLPFLSALLFWHVSDREGIEAYLILGLIWALLLYRERLNSTPLPKSALGVSGLFVLINIVLAMLWPMDGVKTAGLVVNIGLIVWASFLGSYRAHALKPPSQNQN